MQKKVLVSGVKPTGTIHIANYFGAMRQNVNIGNDDNYESHVFIADYHALTTVKDASKLRKETFDLACCYLAIGLDTNKVAFFKQSDVPEHAELACILNNVVTVPYLMRAHAFKDHEAKSKEVNVGLFTYPVLMAADILIYHADIVPVGSDQKQHIEYARDIAGYFNRAWNKEYFHMPEALIMNDVATVPGTDGRKMSKSYENTIPLFGTDEEIRKAVMSIVTDAKSTSDVVNPDENNIYNIHRLFLSNSENSEGESNDIEDLRNRFLKVGKYEGASYSYKQAKESLYEAIIAFVSPMRELYNYYQTRPDEVYAILEKGKVKAQAKARETMREVRDIVGLNN